MRNSSNIAFEKCSFQRQRFLLGKHIMRLPHSETFCSHGQLEKVCTSKNTYLNIMLLKCSICLRQKDFFYNHLPNALGVMKTSFYTVNKSLTVMSFCCLISGAFRLFGDVIWQPGYEVLWRLESLSCHYWSCSNEKEHGQLMQYLLSIQKQPTIPLTNQQLNGYHTELLWNATPNDIGQ